MNYVIIISLIIIFQQFTFARMGTFAITVGAIFSMPLLIFVCGFLKNNNKIFIALLGSFCVVLFKYIVAINGDVSLDKYHTSAALFVMSVLMWSMASGSVGHDLAYVYVYPAVRLSLYIVSFMTAIQSIGFRFFGVTAYHDILGAHSYFGSLDPSIIEVGIRAPGFFIEPSYCAFVIFSLWVAILITGKCNFYDLLSCVLGLIFVQSASGFVAFASIGVLYLYLRGNLRQTYYAAFIFGVYLLLVNIGYIGIVGDRVDQGFVEGSSTYYRVVGPLEVIGHVLADGIFGMPFGSVSDVMKSFGLLHAGSIGTSLDNGLYLILFYFGWFGVAFLLLYFYLLFLSVYRRSESCILLGYFVFAFNFSGGVFLPEFVITSCIPIILSRVHLLFDGKIQEVK